MKMPKLLLLICVLLQGLNALAQTPDSIEADLIRTYRAMLNSQNSYNCNDCSKNLPGLNQVFREKLINYTTKLPFTMEYPFDSFKKERRITIASSADKTFRVYSWDTAMGLTGITYNSLIQYKVDGRYYTKLLEYGEDLDLSQYYDEIYTIKANGSTYCIGLFNGAMSSRFRFTGVKVFVLENTNLNEARVIKTPDKITDEIWISFDCYSCSKSLGSPIAKFDPINKQLTLPVVDSENKLKKKKTIYSFNGQYFVRVKSKR